MVKVILEILTMIALWIGQSKGSLLENRIVAVPEGRREAKPAIAIAETQQAVFAPAVDAGAGMIVREVVPRIAIRRIVLPHCPPLALAQVGPPKIPCFPPLIACEDTLGFSFGGPFRLLHLSEKWLRVTLVFRTEAKDTERGRIKFGFSVLKKPVESGYRPLQIESNFVERWQISTPILMRSNAD